MTDKMKSFVKGILLGLFGHPLPQGEKEPEAYLYGQVAKEGETPTHIVNGVGYVGAVLPKLPEYDKEAYPYAVIVRTMDAGHYELCLSGTVPFVYDSGYSGSYHTFYYTAPYIVYSYYEDDGTWDYIGSYDITDYYYRYKLWSNVDIPNKSDDTVWCAKTDEIPVGEPVAYQYNGVELPNIDEVWTDKRYAYAHISVNDYGVYSLRITAQAIKIGNYNAIPIQYYELINGEWEKQPIDVWSEDIEWGFVWTSRTITNADGTVLLAKSSPTIVYE